LPSTITLLSKHVATGPKKQGSIILRVVVPGVPGVPGVPVVFGYPLLILLVALWLHESDIGLAGPVVSQFAFCLVSSLNVLESANIAVGRVAESTPDTNTIVNRTNTINP
jgi:hypothetical protein